MKKFFMKGLLIAAMMFTANAANAQLSDILGNVASKAAQKVSSSAGDGSVLSGLTNIISSKLIPSSTQVVGTWVYQKPAVMFTSSNALKSAASSLASSKVETKLQSYLTKVGFTQGKMNVVFDSNKSFTVNRSGKKIASGTYTVDSNSITLTFKGRKTPCKLTPQLDNGTLVVVMDATKFKTFLEGIGSSISQLSTITSLMKSMDGMKIGFRMQKK